MCACMPTPIFCLYPVMTGYALCISMRLSGTYAPVATTSFASSTSEGEATCHVFTTGCLSASSAPRNVMALTSFSTVGSIVAGTKPAPV